MFCEILKVDNIFFTLKTESVKQTQGTFSQVNTGDDIIYLFHQYFKNWFRTKKIKETLGEMYEWARVIPEKKGVAQQNVVINVKFFVTSSSSVSSFLLWSYVS